MQHIFDFSQHILILSTSCTKVVKAITMQQAYCTVIQAMFVDCHHGEFELASPLTCHP
jgi:hypothetical protein